MNYLEERKDKKETNGEKRKIDVKFAMKRDIMKMNVLKIKERF